MPIQLQLSEESKLKVVKDLRDGSDPRRAFFMMVALSTMIAAFGLVMNSVAVVIGAMLVAPLMTPILGLGLGLVRGNAQLIGIALRAELAGVVLAVLAATVFGLILPYFEATPEMLARTSPTLLDLLVAVFAGLAGAYALVDARVSPALPGVAISTAIVPPLANTGLSIALGAYEGAWGSFLLFFTNFLSILLVSALVFSLAGLGERLEVRAGLIIARRFGVAVAGFSLVAVLLGSELLKIIEHQRLREGIREVLQSELANFPISDLSKITHTEDDGKLLVLAEVDAPRVLSPQQVSRIQTRVEDKVSRPVHLNIRTTVTKDVSAVGHHDIDFTETLDGFSVSQDKERRRDADDIAEQIVREYLGDKLGVYLEDLREYPFGHTRLLVADVAGSRWLGREEISEIEGLLRNRFESIPVEFRVVQRKSFQRNHKGVLRTQFEIRRPLSQEEQAVADRIDALALDWFSENGFRLLGWSLTILEGEFHVLFEVVGTRLFLPPDQQVLNEKLADNLDVPIALYVRSVLETLVGQEGQMNFDHLLQEYRRRNRAAYGGETRRLIDEMH